MYLWGLSVPALLAGAALTVMGQMALTRWRRKALLRREQALRCRLGGEIFLEELLLLPLRQAHVQAALVLEKKYPLRMERTTDEGVVCISGGEKLLVGCIPLPERCETSAGEVLALQRACRLQGAARCVVCCTGKVAVQVETWAQTCTVPVKVIRREELLRLAGQMKPATDAQLVELGKRRKRLDPGGMRKGILHPDKAKKFFVYGASMLLVYVVTGLMYYPLPGLVCLALGVGCRLCPRGDERL